MGFDQATAGQQGTCIIWKYQIMQLLLLRYSFSHDYYQTIINDIDDFITYISLLSSPLR